MSEWLWRWAGVISTVAVVLRSVTRTGELNLLVNLSSTNVHRLGLIQTIHLHRAAEMRAGRRDAMKRVLLAKDEDALVVDELCAFAELIDRSDFEALRVFVEDIGNQRTKERVRLTTDCEDCRTQADARDQFAAKEIWFAGFDELIR